jgi:hypothetical protein
VREAAQQANRFAEMACSWFKRLKQRLGLESVSGLSQHALLMDVAAKVLGQTI